MNLQSVIVVAALIMLAVLGHTIWHAPVVAVMNFFVQLFTGAHVTG